jgi:3-methyladenine DNA glycosylase AlkD
LARSSILWDRRIAIVATWWFIRNHRYEERLKIAELLLPHREDLIQTAIGWMLREVGKKEVETLVRFLDSHYDQMSRTTLRYAIEKFDLLTRLSYLHRKKIAFL